MSESLVTSTRTREPQHACSMSLLYPHVPYEGGIIIDGKERKHHHSSLMEKEGRIVGVEFLLTCRLRVQVVCIA